MKSGADPGFPVRVGQLKKIAPSGGGRENIWGILCEKSRFYAKKIFFSNSRRRGGRRVRPPWIRPLKWLYQHRKVSGLCISGIPFDSVSTISPAELLIRCWCNVSFTCKVYDIFKRWCTQLCLVQSMSCTIYRRVIVTVHIFLYCHSLWDYSFSKFTIKYLKLYTSSIHQHIILKCSSSIHHHPKKESR